MNKYCEDCKNKAVMHAFSSGWCEICSVEVTTGHIPVDKICLNCATREDKCESCGKEMKTEKESLDIPDIRNKLTPITNMIELFERGEYTYIKNKGLDEVKKSINYLAQRDVYK